MSSEWVTTKGILYIYSHMNITSYITLILCIYNYYNIVLFSILLDVMVLLLIAKQVVVVVEVVSEDR